VKELCYGLTRFTAIIGECNTNMEISCVKADGEHNLDWRSNPSSNTIRSAWRMHGRILFLDDFWVQKAVKAALASQLDSLARECLVQLCDI
jgi:hypothetical protein